MRTHSHIYETAWCACHLKQGLQAVFWSFWGSYCVSADAFGCILIVFVIASGSYRNHIGISVEHCHTASCLDIQMTHSLLDSSSSSHFLDRLNYCSATHTTLHTGELWVHFDRVQRVFEIKTGQNRGVSKSKKKQMYHLFPLLFLCAAACRRSSAKRRF